MPGEDFVDLLLPARAFGTEVASVALTSKDRARIGLGFDSHLPVQVPLHQPRELTYYA